jgi:hypothetical protein
MPEKIKIMRLLPQFFFFFFKKKKKEKRKTTKTCYAENRSNLILECTVRANLFLIEQFEITKTEKQPPVVLFLSSPSKTCRNFPQGKQEKIWG